MPVLEQEVMPAVYTSDKREQYELLRDEIVADIAGLTVAQVVSLERRHFEGIQCESFELPTPIRDGKVIGLRAGNELRLDGTQTAPRGGTRMHPKGGREEVVTLADGMDTKFAINLDNLIGAGIVDPEVEIPVGGKSEILVPTDPRRLTPMEKATVIMEFTEALDDRGYFFERHHRTGPDMNMGEQDMALMRDVLSGRGYGGMADRLITGKPIASGGVEGRKTATARGGAIVLDEYLSRLEVPEGTQVRFSIQGYGNAGGPLVNQFREVSNYEGVLSCIADETGTIHSGKGIDPDAFEALLYETDGYGDKRYRGVMKAGELYRAAHDPDASVVENNENPDLWLEVPADCYVPAALASAINMGNVGKLIKNRPENGARFVLPLANFGVSSPAQIELERAGFRTLYHAHANGYGVTGSLAESKFGGRSARKNAGADDQEVNRILNQVARATTRQLFELSKMVTIVPTASLAVAAEAKRVQVLAQRLGV